MNKRNFSFYTVEIFFFSFKVAIFNFFHLTGHINWHNSHEKCSIFDWRRDNHVYRVVLHVAIF